MPPTLILPFPFGATVISPSVPSVMVIEPEFVPSFVSNIKSFSPSVVIVGLVPPTFILPFPSGATVISPLAPSVIVIEPVVAFPVFNVTSVSPLDLKTPSLPAVPGPVAKAASYVLHSPASPVFPYHKNLWSVTVPVFSFNSKPPLSPRPVKLVAVPLPSTFNSSVGSWILSSVTSKWTWSPSTSRFFAILTFPSLSTANAFTAALFPCFVANTIRSFPSTLRLASPTPRATSPSITSAPVVSFPAIKLFPTTNEFVKLLTLLFVPWTIVLLTFSISSWFPNIIDSLLLPVISPTLVFPIIILSWQSELVTNEPLLLPVKTLIIGFLIIPPEISIAAVKVSNFGFVFVPVTIPFIPPIIKWRSI